MCDFQVTHEVVLDVTRGKDLRVVVRGYNQVGLHSDSIAAVLMPDDDKAHSLLPAVYDVVPSTLSPRLDARGRPIDPTVRREDEIGFTKSVDSLAAGWPWSKQGTWEWAILRDKSSWESCSGSVPTIACGVTKKATHVAVGLALQNGNTYYFCVHLLEITGAHGDDEKLVGGVVCSDGVTVDTTRPQPGNVYLGLGTHGSSYQTFANALFVRWAGFTDVEEHEDRFRTGIKEYSLAIGRSCVVSTSVSYLGTY